MGELLGVAVRRVLTCFLDWPLFSLLKLKKDVSSPPHFSYKLSPQGILHPFGRYPFPAE